MNKPMSSEISQVLAQYDFDFTDVKVSRLGNGHINQTYKVTTTNLAYVLQKINHDIFPNVVALFENTQQINNHLTQQKRLDNYALQIPKQILTDDKNPYLKLGNSYWRLMEYVDNSYTLEEIKTTEQAKLVARTFAGFSCALSDFPANNLETIIDNFHDITFRIEQLTQAIKDDNEARLTSCQHIVDQCLSQHTFIEHIENLSKKLPIHVTHNDTKINNLLFTTGDVPCAVIDLDTCMPGLLMHDFGDMVRTCCSNIAEDATNIEDMVFQLPIFEALIINYQTAFNNKMTKLEKNSLIVGAKLLPFMVAVRFLTDHLNGDKYFNVDHTNHNLERAINQTTAIPINL